MQNAAVISGSLVDAKNVNTHKVMRLIIDVPAENALKVIAAFGWPTMVNPVSVAVARLNDKGATTPRPDQSVGVPAGADKQRRTFTDMSPAQQAGMLCADRAFRLFLAEKFDMPLPDPEEAANVIRHHCKVKSRKDITADNAGWSDIVLAYRLWQREPEIVG